MHVVPSSGGHLESQIRLDSNVRVQFALKLLGEPAPFCEGAVKVWCDVSAEQA